MSSTLYLTGDELPLTDPEENEESIGHEIEVIVDCGPSGLEPTSILDLSGGTVEVLRAGRCDISQFTCFSTDAIECLDRSRKPYEARTYSPES